MLSRLHRLLKSSSPCGFAGTLLGGELLAGAMRGAPQCDWLAPPLPKLTPFAAAPSNAPGLVNAT